MAASGDTVPAPSARRWTSQRRHGGGSAFYAAGMVAALAYYYLVPNPLLALPGLAVFTALAWLRLDLALCLLPLTFPFWYVPKRVLGQAVFPLSEIALGVCLAVAIAHLLLPGLRGTKNAEGAELRGGRGEAEQRGTAEDAEGAEDAEHAEDGGEVIETTGLGVPHHSLFASFAFLRVLHDPRALFRREWRWLLIGAALLLVGTAAGVLVAVRPREALRAFRWDVAEPLLYAGLVIVCLWGRRSLWRHGSRPGRVDAAGGGDSRERVSGHLIAWLAGPVLALGALFGALAIVQVLWLRVTFTALAAGNHLVSLPTATGGTPQRVTGIFYGSPNSLGALLERLLPLALALLLWRVLERGTGNAEDAESRGDRGADEKAPAEAAMNREGASLTSLPESHMASDDVRPASLSSPSSIASMFSVVRSPSGARGEVLLLGACVLLMAVGLALTGSRGAEVGAAVGLLLVLLAHPRARRVAFGIVALSAVVALWQANALLRAALVGHGQSGEVRLLLWQSALHMIRDHPLLGIGPDQFLYYYDPAYTAHPYWIPRIGGRLTPAVFQPDLAHPHNLVLDLWLSGGVLGLAGFVLVVGWLAWSCWRLWRANRRVVSGRWTARTALVVGVAGGVLGGLTHGMVDSAYFQPDLALLFWWAIAVVALAGMGTAAAPRSGSEGMSGATRRNG